MAAIFIGLASVLSLIYLAHRQASFDRELQDGVRERVDAIAHAIGSTSQRPTDADLARLAFAQRQPTLFPTLRMTLVDASGKVIASTPEPAPYVSAPEIEAALRSEDDAPIVARRSIPFTERDQTFRHLMLKRTALPDGSDAVLVGVTPIEGFVRTMDLTIEVILASLAIGIVAAMIAAWVIAGLAHAPLEELRRVAATLLPDRVGEAIEFKSLSPESAVLQHELQGVRQKLAEAFQLQERFISNVSHELKTPIAVLLTEAQTLRSSRMTPAGRRFVQSVTDEMRRLGRMAESFLMLTRLRFGQAAVVMERHRLDDIVLDAVESSAQMSKQHHVVLVASLAEGDDDLTVSGDAALLRVMLDNLVRNAVRFSPSGGRVTIAVEAEEEEGRIIVRDQGPGVPEEEIHRLFDRFTQSLNEESRGRGHGLGLSIAQGVAELHGGRISVRNHPEGGCEFTVTLRLETLDVPEAPRGSAEATNETGRPEDGAGSPRANGVVDHAVARSAHGAA